MGGEQVPDSWIGRRVRIITTVTSDRTAQEEATLLSLDQIGHRTDVGIDGLVQLPVDAKRRREPHGANGGGAFIPQDDVGKDRHGRSRRYGCRRLSRVRREGKQEGDEKLTIT